MLGFPKATELNRQLPKNAIYAKFQMNAAEKERIDKDISRIYIVNEVSAAKVNVEDGKTVKDFFVLKVELKRSDFSEQSIIAISKLIPQNMIIVLAFDGRIKLAAYHTKLMQTDWGKDFMLKIQGLNLDAVWENIITQIGGFTVAEGNTLEEQIHLNEEQAKLKKEIARLEKLARAEKQPKKKFEYVQQIKELRRKMEEK